MEQKFASSVDDVEELGDLPPAVLEDLTRILSKKRLINSHTLNLFLHPENEKVTVYDGASMLPLLKLLIAHQAIC